MPSNEFTCGTLTSEYEVLETCRIYWFHLSYLYLDAWIAIWNLIYALGKCKTLSNLQHKTILKMYCIPTICHNKYRRYIHYKYVLQVQTTAGLLGTESLVYNLTMLEKYTQSSRAPWYWTHEQPDIQCLDNLCWLVPHYPKYPIVLV